MTILPSAHGPEASPSPSLSSLGSGKRLSRVHPSPQGPASLVGGTVAMRTSWDGEVDDGLEDGHRNRNILRRSTEIQKTRANPLASPNIWDPSNGLLNPHSGPMMWWDRIVIVLLVFTAVVTPFEVAMLTPSINALFLINRLVDVLFITDMALTFFLDPEDPCLPTGKWPVVKNYLRGWFFIDLLGSFPFDAVEVVVDGADGLKFIRIMRLMRLVKLSRLTRATRIFERWQDQVAMNYSVVEISKAAIGTLLASHWMACTWFLAAKYTDGPWEETWLSQKGYDPSGDAGENYIAAWYFAVMTMSTIGYGDVYPANPGEQIVASVFMLFGALFYAYIISQVTESVMRLQQKTTEYHTLMDDLNTFLEDQSISQECRRQARCYFRMRHNQNNLKSWGHVLDKMSPDLRMQVSREMHRSWAATSVYFWDAPNNFVAKVSSLFVVEAFPLGEKIFEIGKEVTRLYVLTRGTVMSGFRIIRVANGQEAHVLGETELFSKTFAGTRRSQTCAMALTYCTTYAVSNDNLLNLLDEFPDVRRRVEHMGTRQAFRQHILAYCLAVRMINGTVTEGRSNLETSMVDHYRNKLESLERYKPNLLAIVNAQRIFRGFLIRRHTSSRLDLSRTPSLGMFGSLALQKEMKRAKETKRLPIKMLEVGRGAEAMLAAVRTELHELRKEMRNDAIVQEAANRDMQIMRQEMLEIKALLVASSCEGVSAQGPGALLHRRASELNPLDRRSSNLILRTSKMLPGCDGVKPVGSPKEDSTPSAAPSGVESA